MIGDGMDDDLINQVTNLREFYRDPANRVGKLLDELATDLRKGKQRKKVLKEARKVQKLIGPLATAHGIIDQVVSALEALVGSREA